jgi:Tol biopolymer transport system component
MDHGLWVPCRVVPMDGSSPGRQVGPANGRCTFGAWSPDGKWLYLNSSSGGAFHIWRQRFPSGEPEQITSAVTEEEGIALAPDGRSLITSVALKQSVVYLRQGTREQQISMEGYSFDPKLSRDGRKLFYRILRGPVPIADPSELRVMDLQTGRNTQLFPGIGVSGFTSKAYDVSPDGSWVVASARDSQGKWQIWTMPVDGSLAPVRVPGIEGYSPVALGNDHIMFRTTPGERSNVCLVRRDGTGFRQVISSPIAAGIRGVSPDGKWVVIKAPGQPVVAMPVDGGAPVPLLADIGDIFFTWSSGALFVSAPDTFGSAMGLVGKTYVLPLATGKLLPAAPPNGFRLEDLQNRPGVKIIESYDVGPGPTPDVYAFSRRTTQRNLYKIPLP